MSQPYTRDESVARVRALVDGCASFVFMCRHGSEYSFVNFGEASEQIGLLAMFTEQKRGEIERLFTPLRPGVDPTPEQQVSGAV